MLVRYMQIFVVSRFCRMKVIMFIIISEVVSSVSVCIGFIGWLFDGELMCVSV